MKIKCRPNAKAVRRFKRIWVDYYGYHCAYCTKDCSEHPTIDHVIPLSKGGGNTLDNLVIACALCNIKKANKSVDEFQRLVLQPIKPEDIYVRTDH
jgi:5-methylcytosine-specific restriction endonuclease McrA